MPPPLKSALWAAVITAISGVVLIAGARAPVFTSAPWLAVLALPSLPGYVLAYFFQLGPNSEGIPSPTNIAVHGLTFVVWWGGIHLALARWRRRSRYGRQLR